MNQRSQEDAMGATGKKKQDDEAQEQEVDFMADAPEERPYHEAVSDSHRELLAENGVVLPGSSHVVTSGA
jgi:hypothetical protein